MALEAKKLDSFDDSGKNIDALKQEYAALAEQLPEQDKKACLDWLKTSKESSDPTALESNLKFLRQNADAYGKQMALYEKELKERVKKGLVRGETEKDRFAWFKKLSFTERSRVLQNKDAKLDDLFDPKREANLKEFKSLLEYFGTPLALHKKFTGMEFTDRQKMVSELKEKRDLLEGKILPTIVKIQLKKEAAAGRPLSEFRTAVEKAAATHEEQKTRFEKLPPKVQDEIRKDFKAKLFPERERMLSRVETEMTQYKARYEEQLRPLLQPDKNGLHLFAAKSADKYREWFAKDLSLESMKAFSGNDPELQNPERKILRKRMSATLERIPRAGRPAAIEEFNDADLEKRREVVARHEKGETENGEIGSSKKQTFVHRVIRMLTLSSGHEDIRQKTETFAIADEIALRRERFQLAHNRRDIVHENKGEPSDAHPSDEKKLEQTMKRTDRVEAAMQTERLHDSSGKGKLKLDILETHAEDRHLLRRALKTGVDDQNAKLAGNILLRNRSGEVISDAREYRRGEVHRELELAIGSLLPVLEQEAQKEGIAATEEELKKMAEKADWKSIGKETIRRAA